MLAVMPFADADEALEHRERDVAGPDGERVHPRPRRPRTASPRTSRPGYVWVNEVGRHVPGTPFGGVKDSGIGREEDLDELFSYTQLKNVHINYGR